MLPEQHSPSPPPTSQSITLLHTLVDSSPAAGSVLVGLSVSINRFDALAEFVGTHRRLHLRPQGKRMALPHSRVMIHQPMGGAQGQAEDIKVGEKGLCARTP